MFSCFATGCIYSGKIKIWRKCLHFFILECFFNTFSQHFMYWKLESLYVMMLNANLKSTTVMFITQNNILLFIGNHISHNFTIHIDKHNYYVL